MLYLIKDRRFITLDTNRILFLFLNMEGSKNIRRRGDELLESLFEATFKLMNEVGPMNITFAQIADAAKTSRPVLYRRWSSTFNLLQDVYAYRARKLFEGDFFATLGDTGSLRGDLLALLEVYQGVYMEIGLDVLNNYYYLRMLDKTNEKELPIHTAAVTKHVEAVRKILEAARSRGEKLNNISAVTMMLPFDLIRMENLVRPGNATPDRLSIMVNEVLLPVFKYVRNTAP